MWDLIKAILGIAITIMVISAILRVAVLPVVTIPAAQAQEQQMRDDIERMSDQDLAEYPLFQDSGDMSNEEIEKAVKSAAEAELPAVDATPQAAPEPVATSRLSRDDVDSLGLLTPENGGMRADLWKGVSRDQVETVLKRVHQTGLRSAAARRLLQRALLTKATPPTGAGDGSWLASRVRALHGVGFAEAAGVLMQQLSEADLYESPLAQAWVENQLLHGDQARACRFVSQYVLNTDIAFWRQALLACAALEGDTAKLKATQELATSADRRADPLLYSLVDGVLANNFKTPRLSPDSRLNALHVALIERFRGFINPDVITRMPDVTLRKLIMQPENVSLSLRLQAAEKLVNDHGAANDIDALVKLYESIDFEPGVLESPLKFVQQQQDGSLARALLWQAVGAAKLASGKALVMKVLWERAQADGLTDLPGSLTPQLRDILPEANLAWFSPYVVKNALHSGNLPVAQKWWEILAGNRSLSRDLTVARTDLAVAFGILNGRISPDLLDQWWTTQTLNSQNARVKAMRTLSMLEALDLPVERRMWLAMHKEINDTQGDRGNGPGPIWLRLVGSSIEAGNIGEALLLLIEPTLYVHPVSMSPQGVANIVAGLRYIGLKEDATSLALEAVLEQEKAAY